jgi:hypothetical protein
MREKVRINYKKGKIKGFIESYNYHGIGFGFRAEGNERLEGFFNNVGSAV